VEPMAEWEFLRRLEAADARAAHAETRVAALGLDVALVRAELRQCEEEVASRDALLGSGARRLAATDARLAELEEVVDDERKKAVRASKVADELRMTLAAEEARHVSARHELER